MKTEDFASCFFTAMTAQVIYPLQLSSVLSAKSGYDLNQQSVPFNSAGFHSVSASAGVNPSCLMEAKAGHCLIIGRDKGDGEVQYYLR